MKTKKLVKRPVKPAAKKNVVKRGPTKRYSLNYAKIIKKKRR